MSMPPRQIAFIAEEFTLSGPAQQILDRLLMGVAEEGEFRHWEGSQIVLHLPPPSTVDPRLLVPRRERGLRVAVSLEEALRGTDAAVVVGRGTGETPNAELVGRVIQGIAPGGACFVHGLLARTGREARELSAAAAARRVRLLAGTPVGTTWRLPDVAFPRHARAGDGLIVVQGATPQALLRGLDGLLPFMDQRAERIAGAPTLQAFQGEEVWRAGRENRWPEWLLAPALSRSDNPQGDPVLDGRTQDLVGLGLVPRLARDPRVWVATHPDGARTAVAALDGVTADITLAVGLLEGVRAFSFRMEAPPFSLRRDPVGKVLTVVLSTQLLMAPAPREEHYGPFVSSVRRFLSGLGSWPVGRGVEMAELYEAMLAAPVNVPASATVRPQHP
ncbi:MAG TPA: hypothetical protein DCM86_01350 [Verrucomicrobiales bacterium]|mgnify:CR=1 FL=1|nr:hypothetical protein [Verrucomicrobiales bacterium]